MEREEELLLILRRDFCFVSWFVCCFGFTCLVWFFNMKLAPKTFPDLVADFKETVSKLTDFSIA